MTPRAPLKVCRFAQMEGHVRIGLLADDSTLLDLSPAGLTRLEPLLESEDPVAHVRALASRPLLRVPLADVRLCAPLERQ